MNHLTLFENDFDTFLSEIRPAFWKGNWGNSEELIEHEDKFELSIELPGVSKDDINISFEKQALSIKAEKKRKYDKGSVSNVAGSRDYSVFEKFYRLSDTINKTKIGADYVDGILTVTLPKKPEAKPRKIAVS